MYYRIVFQTYLHRIEGQVSTVVWDASIVLARYLIQQFKKNPEFLRDKNILEIGSGLGLCGMTAAMLGAKFVLMTDLEEAIPLLEYNVEQNRSKFGELPNVQVTALTWSKEEAEKLAQDKIFDYILISDCIYYDESIDALLDTLNVLIKNKKSVILLAQELRESQKQINIFKQFIQKARNNLIFREVPVTEQDPNYQCEEIILYKCTSK